MKSILFIAPSEQVAVRAETVIARRNMSDVEVKLGSFEKARKIVAEAIGLGTKIVVSRGGTASDLRKIFDIPIIDVKFSSGCYIEAFEKIRNVRGKIAFFSVEEIQDTVKTLCYILNVETSWYRFNNEESAEKAVRLAIDEGNVLGVGGAVTGKCASRQGLEYIVLENSLEEIEIALESAQLALSSLIAEEKKRKVLQLQLERYEAIFNYTHDGIIAIDKHGKVEVVNKQAEEILPLEGKPYEGKFIEDVLPSTKLLTTLKNGETETDELMKVGNSIINTNRIPIIIDSKVEGVVATFRDIESIQLSEQKIRSNLHKKGMVSKYRFADMIGTSEAIQKTIRIAKSYAKSHSNVLLLGEIGTGKEMFAHSIHRDSKRRNCPFVTVNCASISSVGLLADLQGYEENACPFGAKGKKEGLFELAHGGTMFLDKIDEAPLEVQTFLLRVLEDKEVRRIGGDHVIPVDVRIIAASSKDLLHEMEAGRFLEELYYMLGVLILEIPPLRKRGGDYVLLCDYWFRREFGAEFKQYEEKIKEIGQYVNENTWKGNIRQLSNFVERVSVLLRSGESVEDIVYTIPQVQIYEPKELADVTMKKWTRSDIIKALSESRLNVSKAARLLHCSRSTLYKKMEEFNIKITNIK